VSFTVQGSRPLVRITSPADRQIFDAGTTSITFQTATSVSDGFIAKVDFYLDSVGLVGTVTQYQMDRPRSQLAINNRQLTIYQLPARVEEPNNRNCRCD
jgi:hypothetical protein